MIQNSNAHMAWHATHTKVLWGSKLYRVQAKYAARNSVLE